MGAGGKHIYRYNGWGYIYRVMYWSDGGCIVMSRLSLYLNFVVVVVCRLMFVFLFYMSLLSRMLLIVSPMHLHRDEGKIEGF